MNRADRIAKLIKFLKEYDPEKLKILLWKFNIKTGFSIELRGNTVIFSGGNPDLIVAQFYQFCGGWE